MKKKILSLLLIGVMTCSTLVGCTTGSRTTEMPKEGTELKDKDKTEIETESTETGDVNSSTEGEVTDAETVLPEGTYVRAVKDGFIKEIQSGDGLSHYKLSWGNEKVTGTQTDLNIEFQSISNLGSWTDENEDSGVWRYINGDEWVTALAWGCGIIPSSDNKLMTIDETNVEDIKSILSTMTVYEDTLSIRKSDNYVAATMKVDRTEAGLSGYVTIIDDLETDLRWIVQFLMLTDAADYDMLKASAESLTIGSDFDRASLEAEVKLSAEPLVISPQEGEISQDSNETSEETPTETPTEN